MAKSVTVQKRKAVNLKEWCLGMIYISSDRFEFEESGEDIKVVEKGRQLP